jgi:hypothetical protein
MITKTNANRFHADLIAAIKSVEEKYGVTIEAPSLRYGEAGGTVSVKFSNLRVDGEKITDKRHEFYAALMLKSKAAPGVTAFIGAKMELANGKIAVLRDYDTKKPKYPCLYTLDGKNYKCSADFVKRVF